MSLLSTADISQMRGVLDDSLPDTAIVKTENYVSDGGGGGSASWTNAGTYPCRLVAATPSENPEGPTGSRVTADADWLLTLPANTPITRESQVSVGARTFRVEAIRAPRSWEISRRVDLSEVVF